MVSQYSVFIDGRAGTCGLEIEKRLRTLDHIQLLQPEEAERKSLDCRLALAGAADFVITCLPDEASRELIEQMPAHVRVIDASTAFRTAPGWVYGLPEMTPDQRHKIQAATRVSNPGCYPTAVILMLKPLLDEALLRRSAEIFVYAQSGYSGGGGQLIKAYEEGNGYKGARPYALNCRHKHLPEMHQHSGLEKKPLFMPGVGDYYRGMLVEIPVRRSALKKGVQARHCLDCWMERYATEPLIVIEETANALLDGHYLNPAGLAGKDFIELAIFGDEDNLVLVGRLDNLNKGASGAAVQNLNLMLGVGDEFAGLTLPESGRRAQKISQKMHAEPAADSIGHH